MSSWPPWRRQNEPAALLRYVHPDGTAAHLRVPGPSSRPREETLREIFEALVEKKVRYAFEPPVAGPSVQIIRTPDEVLWCPKHATCLDLSLVFSGACLKAGLHPLVVLLAPSRPGGDAHALVVVWNDGSWNPGGTSDYPLRGDVLDAVNSGRLRNGLGRKEFLAVDPSSAALSVGVAGQKPLSFEAALQRATEMLASERAWELVVDVGTGFRADGTEVFPGKPAHPPLHTGYAALSDEEARGHPLSLIRADYGVVPFAPTAEAAALQEWLEEPGRPGVPRIAAVHGVGGAGKTRLMQELALRFEWKGWYAGRLRAGADVNWLASVSSPLLIGVDYADAQPTMSLASQIQTLLGGRSGNVVFVLTARLLGGWWEELLRILERERARRSTLEVMLPDRYSEPAALYESSIAAFRQRLGERESDVRGLPRGDWTTLDIILLAWLEALGEGMPGRRVDLYDEILRHERGYLVRAWRQRYESPPPDFVFDLAAAIVALLNPDANRIGDVLDVVSELKGNSGWKSKLADTLLRCWPPGLTGEMAISPDPVGDRLWVRVISERPGLFTEALRNANGAERRRAFGNVSRASREYPEETRAFSTRALENEPGLWKEALDVAGRAGGSLLKALAELAGNPGGPLPVSDLAAAIPVGHATLRFVALKAAGSALSALELNGDAEPVVLARALNTLSIRQIEAGQRPEALASIKRAVKIHERLAASNPGAFEPNLAMSLNNLATRQLEAGKRKEALASIERAVEIYGRLAAINPKVFEAGLTAARTLQERLRGRADRTAHGRPPKRRRKTSAGRKPTGPEEPRQRSRRSSL